MTILRIQDELTRLKTLEQYRILDTDPEEVFDDIVYLAKDVCQAPVAIISFIDSHRQWIKARVGLKPIALSKASTLCKLTLEAHTPIIVKDSFKDCRFSTALLPEANADLCSCISLPLISPEGSIIGTLSVFDKIPREFSNSQIEAMERLARQTILHLESRRRAGSQMQIEMSNDSSCCCSSQLSIYEENGKKRIEEILKRQTILVELAKIDGSDLEATLKKIVKVVSETLSIAQVGVWLYTEDRSKIVCQVLYKRDSDSYHKDFYIDANLHPIYFSSFEQYRIVAAHDAQHDPRTKEFSEGYLVPNGITSMLDAPIRSRGELIGVICHEHIGNPREWTLEEQEFAGSIADLISRVLESAERTRAEQALRRSEELLRHSQKMEAIGMLAGGVAHDFNNLLTAILGYSDLLLKRLDRENSLYRSAEEIKKAGERAASLTRQLLAFSRKQVLQPKIFNLNSVVADMDKLLRRLIGEDIDLVTCLDSDLGLIETDPGQIEQVILNLAVNARDAMPSGGKLTIETSNVELDQVYASGHAGVRPGPYVMIAVTDTGYGMDEETLSHIFEPFFTTKGVGRGTGLGLSTVYGIVKQSSGNVWVYSEPGNGTTFKVYLPRVQSYVREPLQDEPLILPPQGSETILVVEDDEIVRKMTQEILSINGYSVLEAANSAEALLTCNKHPGPIQLMITDVVMPQMSGCELAEQVASIRPEMAVLYMSGYTGNALIHHGVLIDSNAFISKPFTPDSLAGKVRELLDTTR
jgi:signal transduction histidine kinase